MMMPVFAIWKHLKTLVRIGIHKIMVGTNLNTEELSISIPRLRYNFQ